MTQAARAPRRSLSIVARLRLTFALMILACIGVVGWLTWRNYVELLDSRLRATRSEVAQAIEIAQRHHAQIGPGTTEEQARAKAVEEIMKIRYDGKEYVWINDMHPRMVGHPFKPELNGKDIGDFKDPTGKRLFIEMVARIKESGDGYVDYLWPKPERPEPEPKRSFVKAFAPWGWVVGSGVYVDDVRAAALKQAQIALAVMVGFMVFALVAVEFIARGMRSRLAAAGSLMERMANGDLSQTAAPGAADEVGRLLQQAGTTQQRLATLVRQIHRAAESIGVASREIATGNQDLSARTEQTASNLQHAASAMVQLTGTVRQSADSAAQANRMAQSAAEVARRGGAVVSDVVSTMNDIHASARKIEEIIAVIDGLAFQTNILALNASVEAARAGEQGRGFAVVAGEVRGLAQRSAEAARQIKALIGESVERVDAGTRLVADAGSTITEVVTAAQQVSQIIGEVTIAATEQSTGLAGVNQSVTQLDQMTQQNAALVEQASAAAAALRSQAQELVTAVGTFRVGEEAVAA